MAQATSVQAVIEAFKVFELHTDKSSIDAASKWLQDFQHAITYDFNEVDPAHRQGLRDSLVAAIQQYASGPRVVLVQICLALACFVLQYPEWDNPVADLVASLGQQPETVPALLEFLTVVAEEVTTNSRIPISVSTRSRPSSLRPLHHLLRTAA
ncbi:Nuclear import receptor [Ceratobasidium sp. 428]|nr:Nuclear import receptor [Ceratobasidium sp. 428]